MPIEFSKGVTLAEVKLTLEVHALIRLTIDHRAVITEILVAAWTFEAISGAKGLKDNLPLTVGTSDNGPFLQRATASAVIDGVPTLKAALSVSHKGYGAESVGCTRTDYADRVSSNCCVRAHDFRCSDCRRRHTRQRYRCEGFPQSAHCPSKRLARLIAVHAASISKPHFGQTIGYRLTKLRYCWPRPNHHGLAIPAASRGRDGNVPVPSS